MTSLLFGHAETVVDWYTQKQGCEPPIFDTAIGILDNAGALRGAVVLRTENSNTICLGMYCERINFAAIMRQLCVVLFDNCYRVQIRVKKKNKHMKKHAPRLGFKFEGVSRDYYAPGQDALVFYMTADSCRWNKSDERTRRANAS